MVASKRDNSIDYARAFACLLVLLGHSFPDSAYGFVNIASMYLHTWLYSFHMALFFVISGWCFHKAFMLNYNANNENWQKRGGGIAGYARKKTLRLLVPYFTISIVCIVPKLVFNRFLYRPLDSSEIWKILIGDSPSGTLWFLWHLFVISMIFAVLFVCARENLKLMGTLSAVLYVIYVAGNGTFLDETLKYCIFFWCGIILGKYYVKVREINQYIGMILALAAFTAMCATVAWEIMYGYEGKVAYLLTGVLGSAVFFEISIAVDRSGCTEWFRRFLNFTSRNSYGIYLLSPFIAVPIRAILYNRLHAPYFCCFLSMLVLGYVLPCIAVKIIRHSKILSVCILGESTRNGESERVN